MSNLVNYAKRELERAGYDRKALKDPVNKEVYNNILQIVKVFSKQNHSGFSANYARSVLSKLLQFEPIKPYEGKEDEWSKLGDSEDCTYQHRGHSYLFRYDGVVYSIQGYAFTDKLGTGYVSGASRRYFRKFPTPAELETIRLPKKWENWIRAKEATKRAVFKLFVKKGEVG